MIRRMMAAAAAALCASAAQADVVYNWQQIAGSPTIISSSGRITFADGALPGPISYEYNGVAGPARPDPGAPIRSFFFGALVSDQVGPRNFQVGARTDIASGGQIVELTGVTSLGTGLTGGLSALNANSDAVVTLLSDPTGLWTIAEANDGQVTIGRGATGRWVFSGVVPEPGVLPLLALGAVGVAASLRRRSKAR